MVLVVLMVLLVMRRRLKYVTCAAQTPTCSSCSCASIIAFAVFDSRQKYVLRICDGSGKNGAGRGDIALRTNSFSDGTVTMAERCIGCPKQL